MSPQPALQSSAETLRWWRRELGGEDVYNETEALAFVRYSQAAFCDRAPVEGWGCGSPCEAPIVNDSVHFLGPGQQHEVQGFVALLPNSSGAPGPSCLVVFRGTANFANWLTDSEAKMVPWPPDAAPPASVRWPNADSPPLPRREGVSWCHGCKAHSGITGAYQELRLAMAAALRELSCRRVSVTGHSLGAGVATLAVLDIRRQMALPTHPVYLFGAPNVGNPAFKQSFVEAAEDQGFSPAAWRIVHNHDPVPRLHIGDYVHVPREVYYYTEQQEVYRVCDASGQDPSCSSSVPLWRCLSDDHLTYLNASFALGKLPATCVASRPKVSTALAASMVLGLLLLCCLGCCFTCLRQRLRRRNRADFGDDGRGSPRLVTVELYSDPYEARPS